MKQIYKKVTMLIAILLATGALMAQQNTTNLTVKQDNKVITTQTSNDRITNKSANSKSALAKPHVYQGNNRSANVLLLKDENPWAAFGGEFATDPNETLLTNLGISYTVANSSQIATLDFSPFTMIMIASTQPDDFCANYNASLAKFTDFVNAGGNMEIHAAVYSSNTTLPLLPGGGNLAGTYPDDYEYYNIVSLPTHPMMAGVPSPFYGERANHLYFENLPAGAKVITRAQNSNQPTTIEYAIGGGVVVATTCPLEWAIVKDQGAASILSNSIEYIIKAMPRHISLTVQNGANISLDFAADANNTPITIKSGNQEYNITIGTTWTGTQTYTASTSTSTMTIYGNINKFDCSGNTTKLTGLDVSNNKALTYLSCSRNALNSLDVSGCSELTTLYCDKNQLTSLDISQNTSLNVLSCHDNPLSSQAVDALFCSLPDRNSLSNGTLYILNNTSDNNYADVIASNKNNATSKNWKVWYGDYDYATQTFGNLANTDIPVTTGTYVCGSSIVAVTGVSVAPTSVTLTAGNTQQLSANIQPIDATYKNVTWSTSNATVATVVNGKVTAVKAGTATITVTTADGGFKATCKVTVVVPVTGVSLDIATATITKGNTKRLTATVSPTNATNQTVTWSSDNTAVATVDNNGLVTAVAAGTATITVTTEDGGFTATCVVTVKIVPVTGVSLNENSKTLKVGNNFTLTATVEPADATNKNVTWSTSNANVATVSNGIVTAVAAGTATITVTTEDGGKTATCKITVTQPVTGVSLDMATTTIIKGNTKQLTATVQPTNATNQNVSWSSDNTAVATVDNNGLVTAVAPGTATITVTTEDGGKTATCKITVTQPITGVSLNENSKTLKVGNNFTLTATVEPANATNKTITWSTSDATIATVVNGKVTGVKAGTATITVTTEDGGKTATCKITVEQPVTGVSLNENSKTLKVGNNFTLIATVEPADAANKQVDWSSSNNAVATVNANGVVTAKAIGYTTIWAITKDGHKKASCSVLVNSAAVPVTGVSLDKTTATITEGNTLTLIATVQPANATNKDVIWSSNNVSVATVSNGIVTAVGVGKAIITVKTVDGNFMTNCVVTVNAATVAVTGVSLDKTTATVEVGNTQQLTATVLPNNATNKAITWSSSNNSVATVDNTGKVTAIAPGTANITVKTVDKGKTAVCVVTVPDNTPPATPTITVVNHCGYSVLTAGNYTGELLWSNGKTDKQITVTTTGVYTLVQKVNGVSSNQASANVAIWQTPGKPTITVEVDTLTATAATKYYWFLDNSPITDNNMQRLVINKSGNYSVQIESDKGCKSEVSDKIYVVFSSVEDQEVRIEVYPNPVTDQLTVEGLPTAGTPELKLYNVAGQLIVHKRCSNSIEKIDMSDKVSGIYLLKIVDDNVSRSIKIVKK